VEGEIAEPLRESCWASISMKRNTRCSGRGLIVVGDAIEEHVLSEQVIDVGVPIGADWDPTSSVTLTIDPRGFGCVNHVVT